jgi:hypothetical protein
LIGGPILMIIRDGVIFTLLFFAIITAFLLFINWLMNIIDA